MNVTTGGFAVATALLVAACVGVTAETSQPSTSPIGTDRASTVPTGSPSLTPNATAAPTLPAPTGTTPAATPSPAGSVSVAATERPLETLAIVWTPSAMDPGLGT